MECECRRRCSRRDGVDPLGTTPRAIYQPEGLLYMSYVQAAVYDAAMKIDHRYAPYSHFSAPAGNASIEAAVSRPPTAPSSTTSVIPAGPWPRSTRRRLPRYPTIEPPHGVSPSVRPQRRHRSASGKRRPRCRRVDPLRHRAAPGRCVGVPAAASAPIRADTVDGHDAWTSSQLLASSDFGSPPSTPRLARFSVGCQR